MDKPTKRQIKINLLKNLLELELDSDNPTAKKANQLMSQELCRLEKLESDEADVDKQIKRLEKELACKREANKEA